MTQAKTHKATHHTNHLHRKEVVLRLKRLTGHLEKVTEMIESDRSCLEVLQQLSAVTSALNSTKALVAQDHLISCIKPALKKTKPNLLFEVEEILKQATRI